MSPSRRIAPWPCEYCVRNGEYRKMLSRAPRRWRGGASREARRPSIAPYRNGTAPRGAGGAHGNGAREYRAMPCRAPRRGAAARWGHRALPPSRTGEGARAVRTECQAAHRAEARRRDGDIAPYRQAARAGRTATGHEVCARAVRTATGRRHAARGAPAIAIR